MGGLCLHHLITFCTAHKAPNHIYRRCTNEHQTSYIIEKYFGEIWYLGEIWYVIVKWLSNIWQLFNMLQTKHTETKALVAFSHHHYRMVWHMECSNRNVTRLMKSFLHKDHVTCCWTDVAILEYEPSVTIISMHYSNLCFSSRTSRYMVRPRQEIITFTNMV